MPHQQKITFGEMRASDPRGLLVYCSGYRCSHLVKLGSAGVGRWSDSARLSDLEPICLQGVRQARRRYSPGLSASEDGHGRANPKAASGSEIGTINIASG